MLIYFTTGLDQVEETVGGLGPELQCLLKVKVDLN